MVEQKRLKDIVEGAKPRSKALARIAPKPPPPPIRFPDQIEFTEMTDTQEKQNSDKADKTVSEHYFLIIAFFSLYVLNLLLTP